MVSNERSAEFLGSVTSSQEIREYFTEIITLKFTFFKSKEYVYFNDRGTSLIGDTFFFRMTVRIDKKFSVPTKRATVILIRAKSWKVLLRLVLLFASIYLNSVLR